MPINTLNSSVRGSFEGLGFLGSRSLGQSGQRKRRQALIAVSEALEGTLRTHAMKSVAHYLKLFLVERCQSGPQEQK